MSLSATQFLNTSRDDDFTTISLGSPFQCLTNLPESKFFLIPNLNLSCHNLRSFPLVLSLVTWKKRPTPTLSQSPFRSLITPKTPCLTFCCHSRIETIIRFCATSETLHRCFIYSQMILDGCHYMKKYLFPKAYMERVK